MLYKSPGSMLRRLSFKEATVEQVFYEYLTEREVDIKRTLGYDVSNGDVQSVEFKKYLLELEDNSDYSQMKE